MQLSIIILNYNVRYFLELCIRSVEVAVKHIDAEIIVIDNKSSDDSCAMIKQVFPSVTLIENNENFGFSKGNNIGVAAAKGEYICILNPDTVVGEDTFVKALQFAESKKNLGILGCQLIDGRGKFLPESKRQLPTPMIAFQKLIGNSKKYYTNRLNQNEIGKTDILVGAFMLMKQSVYHEVNGFDEDYFMYGEDIDLSYKVIKARYTNYYFGQTTIIHFKGESTLKDKTYAKQFYGAMEIFYRKHFRRNPLSSFLVKIGLKLALKVRIVENPEPIPSTNAVLVSHDISKQLKEKFGDAIVLVKEMKNIQGQTQIIFDTDYVNYKAIIEFMTLHANTNGNTYRLWLKSSNFILGSDNSYSRGEIIHL